MGRLLGAVALGLVAVAAWAALAPLRPGSPEVVYVIPKGTGAKREAGTRPSVLPSQVDLVLGIRDVLVLRNEDEVEQRFGPLAVPPGATYRLPFHTPAEFQLACSLHKDSQVVIKVHPAPAIGWPRLAWRVRKVLAP